MRGENPGKRTGLMSRTRALVGLAVAAAVAWAGCEGDPAGPSDREGLAFQLGGAVTGSFAASDTMEVGENGLPEVGEWAVAADPDSVGGIVLSAFRPMAEGEGDLFVLQLFPARTGTFEPCGPDEDCRGRIFFGLLTDFSDFDDWFEVVSGEAEVTEITEDRLRGRFDLVLRSEGGQGDRTVTVEDGTFDVPFAGADATGVIECRIGGLGGGAGC